MCVSLFGDAPKSVYLSEVVELMGVCSEVTTT